MNTYIQEPLGMAGYAIRTSLILGFLGTLIIAGGIIIGIEKLFFTPKTKNKGD